MAHQKLFLSNKDMPDELLEEKTFGGFYITNPHIPFYLFTPIVLTMFGIALFASHLLWWEILGGIFASMAFWTVFEYTMHRYFFHWEPTGKFWKKFLYTIHHGHHDYPNDKRMMLVGPLITIPAFLILWGIGYLLFGAYAHPFMGGLGSCYMFYDWLHFAAHNYTFKNPVLKKLKMHHLKHHYEDDEKNYGFTTFIWDELMGTTIKHKKSRISNKFNEQSN